MVMERVGGIASNSHRLRTPVNGPPPRCRSKRLTLIAGD
jgi:hypothetical protein